MAIPVAANLVSGAYEIGRMAYRNAENRLAERRKTTSAKGLEESVQSEEDSLNN